MTQVRCGVTSCSYNKAGDCYVDSVNVGGRGAASDSSTCCGSFLYQPTYSNLAEYTSYRGAVNTVNCNVNSCAYNRDCKCEREEIEVGGNCNATYYSETMCASFCKNKR